MIIENPAAFPFFITEGIYLQQKDIPAKEKPKTTVIETVERKPVLTFTYAGNNQKQFLVICHYPNSDAMPDKHLDALKSVLQRKELALTDVAILNLAKHNWAGTQHLTEYFKPDRLLLLGQPTQLTGWDTLALNQLGTVENYKALYSYSFAEMIGDRDKTKAFWEQMKQL